MNKKTKNLKARLKKIFGDFIIYIPLIILMILGAGYVYLLLTSPISIERLQTLIGLDVGIASIAGLSLYASYTSRDEERKSTYFECGEYLFHAFILMFIATFMRGCLLLLDDFSWYAVLRIPIEIIFRTVIIIFFVYGLF